MKSSTGPIRLLLDLMLIIAAAAAVVLTVMPLLTILVPVIPRWRT